MTDLATGTQAEISTTSRTIQILGAAGTGSTMPAIPAPEVPDTIELEDTDQEEEQLRQKLQAILRSCVKFLGNLARCASPPCRQVTRCRWEGRGEEGGKAPQKAAIPRALWYAGCTLLLRAGRDCGVHQNPFHEARESDIHGGSVEAYHFSDLLDGAACGTQDAFFNLSLSWHHSVKNEASFKDPFQAALDACSLTMGCTSRSQFLQISFTS